MCAIVFDFQPKQIFYQLSIIGLLSLSKFSWAQLWYVAYQPTQ